MTKKFFITKFDCITKQYYIKSLLFTGNLKRKATKNEEEQETSETFEYSKFDIFRIAAKSGLFYPLTLSFIVLLGGIESFGQEMASSIAVKMNTLLIIFYWSSFGRGLRNFMDKIPFILIVPTFLAVMAWLEPLNEKTKPQ